MQNTQAGLNFASEDEAAKFKSSVEQKLLERHQRRMSKLKKEYSNKVSNNWFLRSAHASEWWRFHHVWYF